MIHVLCLGAHSLAGSNTSGLGVHVLDLCFNCDFHESARSAKNHALDHLLSFSSGPKSQTPPSGVLCSRRSSYRRRTSHQGSRTRPPRWVVVRPSSNDKSGTESLDHPLIGPSPNGKSRANGGGKEFQGIIGPRVETLLDAGTLPGTRPEEGGKENKSCKPTTVLPNAWHIAAGGRGPLIEWIRLLAVEFSPNRRRFSTRAWKRKKGSKVRNVYSHCS